MQAVKSRNTVPELIVRKLVHALGYRFRLHRADLPGKPDLVFPSKRKVVFVHGCFWHGHNCKRGARAPKQNADYWRRKITRNVERDATNLAALQAEGWSAEVIWECEIRENEELAIRLQSYLQQ
jgi:DNA mismatch endonuclease (patch repair protein)